jgi:hypothetical protein
MPSDEVKTLKSKLAAYTRTTENVTRDFDYFQTKRSKVAEIFHQ